MQTRFQKYTIFNRKSWKVILPLLLLILSRGMFLFYNNNEYINFSLPRYFIYPLLFDSLFFLFGLLIFSLRFTKLFLIIFSCALVFSNLIYIQHFKIYFLPPGTGAIAALFETTPLEAIEFTKLTSISDLIESILISIIPLVGLIVLHKIQINFKQVAGTLTLFLLLSIPFFVISTTTSSKLKPVDYSYLYRDVKNIYHYAEEYYTLVTLRENRKNTTFNATQKDTVFQHPQCHVLIIGESLARNHMSVYGYQRKTTPRLDTASEILFYTNVISPTTQTRSSIVRMLTTSFGLNTERFYEEGSIITAMKDAGYITYWISNQGRYGISDTETSALADDADESFYVNTDWNSKSLDEKVFPPLINVLNQEEHHQFIIIHMLGSHFEYKKRIPDGDEFLLKDNFSSQHLSVAEQKKVDAYDATVKYTDFVIDSIIKLVQLQSKLSTLTFVSDHGEDIFDDDRKLLGHGSPLLSRFTVEIPFLIWQSPGYKKISPINNQSNNLNQFYNNGNLFHSLGHLYHLNFNDLDYTRSIFNKGVDNKTYPFVINSNNQKIDYLKLKEQ